MATRRKPTDAADLQFLATKYGLELQSHAGTFIYEWITAAIRNAEHLGLELRSGFAGLGVDVNAVDQQPDTRPQLDLQARQMGYILRAMQPVFVASWDGPKDTSQEMEEKIVIARKVVVIFSEDIFNI